MEKILERLKTEGVFLINKAASGAVSVAGEALFNLYQRVRKERWNEHRIATELSHLDAELSRQIAGDLAEATSDLELDPGPGAPLKDEEPIGD